jgi:hypothetical protein
LTANDQETDFTHDHYKSKNFRSLTTHAKEVRKWFVSKFDHKYSRALFSDLLADSYS